MLLSKEGELLIKKFESFSSTAYKDIAGIWTIGWGHTYGVGERTPRCSDAQAKEWFDDDIKKCESAILEKVKIILTQSELDALCSFIFNVGVSRFSTSTLLRKLNSGDIQGAGRELDRWVFVKDPLTQLSLVSKGLAERRLLEKHLFLRDFYEARKKTSEG